MAKEKNKEIKTQKDEEKKKAAGAEKEEKSEKRDNEKKKKEKKMKKDGGGKEKSKKKEKKKVKKDKAVVNGKNLEMSTKYSVAICNLIRGKKIGEAVKILRQVKDKKKAVPVRGEIAHKKGMESGKYPVKASTIFIKLLKQLTANSHLNGLEKPYIKTVKADVASRPYRRFGSRRKKRTNVYLETREIKQEKKK